MPLPWKKARISRISRLMADLHPSKPCNPMLVQTGFPTSLVDLFVKNCDSLKRPIKRKKNHKPHRNNHHQQSRQVQEVVSVSDPSAAESPPVNLNDNEFMGRDNLEADKSVNHRFENIRQTNETLNGSDTGCCGGDGRGVLYAGFLVFVAVILALVSFKFLTTVITTSACVLIFLECNRFPLQLPFLRFRAVGVWGGLSKEEDKAEIIAEEDTIELNSPAEEIESAESEKFGFESEDTGTNLRLGCSEEEDHQCDVVTLEKVRIRRRRSSGEIIKKMVPKKWRKARKVKATEEFAGSNEQVQELFNSDNKERSTELDLGSNHSSKRGKSQLIEEGNEITNQFQTELESAVAKKEKKKGCCFLLLVALAGLVGGRILALGLTVVSCFIIQLVLFRGRKQFEKLKSNRK